MESQNEKDYMEIDLVEIFYILKKNIRNIFVVTLCCVLIAAGWLFTKRTVPVYESEACLQITPMQQVLSGNGSGGVIKSMSLNPGVYDGLNTTERMQTCVAMLKRKSGLQKVADALGETGTVVAEPIKNTRLLKVKFIAGNPEVAKKGNELLIREFQSYMSDKEQNKTRYISRNGMAAGAGTGEEMSSVEAVVVSHTEVEIVDEPTLPKAPIVPNRTRTLAVSALVGLLIGSGYAIMHALMNRKITTRKDVEDYLGLPVLAVVPEPNSLEEVMVRCNNESFLQMIGGFLWKEQN